MDVEGWTLDFLLRRVEEAVTFAVRHGLPVMFVTEDTTRAHPDTLTKLYTTAIYCGAQAVCIADTVGHATPRGAYGSPASSENSATARRPAPASTGTATGTGVWTSPTSWPPSRPGPTGSTGRPSASGNGPAIPRWNSSSST